MLGWWAAARGNTAVSAGLQAGRTVDETGAVIELGAILQTVSRTVSRTELF
jgi:hypothetical protein